MVELGDPRAEAKFPKTNMSGSLYFTLPPYLLFQQLLANLFIEGK